MFPHLFVLISHVRELFCTFCFMVVFPGTGQCEALNYSVIFASCHQLHWRRIPTSFSLVIAVFSVTFDALSTRSAVTQRTRCSPDLLKKKGWCVFSKWRWSRLLRSDESPRCVCKCLPWAARRCPATVWTHPVSLFQLPWPNTSDTVGGCQVPSASRESLAAAAIFITIIIIIICWRHAAAQWPSTTSSSSSSAGWRQVSLIYCCLFVCSHYA